MIDLQRIVRKTDLFQLDDWKFWISLATEYPELSLKLWKFYFCLWLHTWWDSNKVEKAWTFIDDWWINASLLGCNVIDPRIEKMCFATQHNKI